MSRHLDKHKIEQAFRQAANEAVSGTPDARAGRYRMATVYFVREGRGSPQTNEGEEIRLDDIVKAFPNVTAIWSERPPTFNPQCSTNPVSDYRWVVVFVHVRGAETSGQFTKDGYWILDGVTPSEFRKKFPNASNLD